MTFFSNPVNLLILVQVLPEEVYIFMIKIIMLVLFHVHLLIQVPNTMEAQYV
jgi:hypothetical protein